MTQILSSLVQSSLFLAVAGIVAIILLRYVHLKSHRIHSWIWWLVLANGIMLTHVSVSIPWHRASLADNDAQSRRSEDTTAWYARDSQGTDNQPQDGKGQVSLAGIQNSNWPTILCCVWGAGMVIILLRWIVDFSRFQQACQFQQCHNPPWSEQWCTLLEESGIKPAIPMHVTPALGPFLCRSLSGYRLVVPRWLWTSITEQQRESILRHELAHYQRSDVWISVAAHLLALPHWFNPIAWVAVRKLEECSEWACDDAATVSKNCSTANYAKALLAICERSSQRSAWSQAMSGGILSRRIERIVMLEQTRDTPTREWLVATTMLVIVLIQAVRVELVAQDPQPGPVRPAPSRPEIERASSVWRRANEANSGSESMTTGSAVQDTDSQPDTARDYYERGKEHENTNKLKEALEDYKRAGELDPQFFDAHFTRSSLLAEMKDYHGAIAALTASLKARPKSYSALFNRGLYYEYVGQYDKAIADYGLAFAEDADFSFHVGSPEECRAHAHHYRGRAFEWFMNNDNRAIADYSEALRLDPTLEKVLERRAMAYHRTREFAKAHDDFERLFELGHQSLTVLTNWAWQSATCPDAEYRDGLRALDLLADIKDLDLGTTAAAYAETGKYDDAIATQKRAIERLNRAPEPKSQQAAEQRAKRLKEMQERLTIYKARRPYRDE